MGLESKGGKSIFFLNLTRGFGWGTWMVGEVGLLVSWRKEEFCASGLGASMWLFF